jgi:hypothetical protein
VYRGFQLGFKQGVLHWHSAQGTTQVRKRDPTAVPFTAKFGLGTVCVNHVFAGQLNHRCCFQRFHVTNRAVLIGTLRDSATVLASCTAGNRYCSELLLGGPALLMKTGETACLVRAGTRAAVATGQHAFAGQLIAVHTRLSSANYCTRSATDRFAAVSAFRRSEGQLSERQTTITKGQNPTHAENDCCSLTTSTPRNPDN